MEVVVNVVIIDVVNVCVFVVISVLVNVVACDESADAVVAVVNITVVLVIVVVVVTLVLFTLEFITVVVVVCLDTVNGDPIWTAIMLAILRIACLVLSDRAGRLFAT